MVMRKIGGCGYARELRKTSGGDGSARDLKHLLGVHMVRSDGAQLELGWRH